MILAEVMLAARDWLWPAAALAIVALAAMAWCYRQARSGFGVRAAGMLLKTTGIAALALCLVEPLVSGMRPRPGSNLFLVMADNSRSLQIHDVGSGKSRGEQLKALLDAKTSWQTRLAQDFDVRRYAFDARLDPVKDFTELTADGDASALAGSLTSLSQRLAGLPVAGVLLLTDGNATDLSDGTDWSGLPPVYPVVMGGDEELTDLSIARVAVSQTNFEAAPVTLLTELECQGIGQQRIVLRVLNEDNKEVDRRTVVNLADGQPLVERFQLKPERPGISFYTVQASLEGEEELAAESGRSAEATLANNRRIATVDRGGGPYRVLYVTGRPNWEFKFLRRAMQEDDEVNLLGLVRIAKKEPKFTYRSRPGERTNSLFRGFGNQHDEEAEQYDEPVLLRLGTEDEDELRGGFPKSADELFRYHALIFDDIEAEFFTQQQMSLVQQFVSQRGGGFLMLGGRESFAKGNYDRTPVGELLPVYLDRAAALGSGQSYQLTLTREGWLQPWVRMRTTEADEQRRLAEMPALRTINAVSGVKPGASVLARVKSGEGKELPALVVQQFGRGRSGALLLGDLWKWNLHRKEGTESELEKSWRQTVRWLVADVPKRVEVETRPAEQATNLGQGITIRARDEMFEPLDNATVAIEVHTPDKRRIELSAEASERTAGEYLTSFAARTPGAYRATVTVKGADGSDVGTREAGWSVEPAADEFRKLKPNRELLARIAKQTGGEVIEANRLDAFVAGLPNRKIPIVEAWTYPLWHQWSVFLFAIGCLASEWGLRRIKGLP
jgi:uncharacterized membrane protein